MTDVKVLTFQDIYGEATSPTGADEKEVQEYNDLVTELGLNNLSLDREANPDHLRLPKLNQFESMVYHTLCPRSIELANYKEEIPLRVLKAFKLAKPMVPADYTFYVMKADKDPDPILVAKRYSWQSDDCILIARWGEELLDFPSLVKRAKEKIIQITDGNVAKLRAFLHTYNEDKEAYATAYLNGQMSDLAREVHLTSIS